MQKHLIAAALFIGLAAMIGCSNNNDEDPTLSENPGQQVQKADTTLTPTRTAQHYPSLVSTNGDFALTSEQQTSVRKNNAFALRLFNTIAPDGQSTVFSPLSLTLALAFCADGSTGQTREEIMTTLGLDDSQPNSVNELCATLIQNTMKADTATTFNIANAFFLNSAWGFTLLPDYTERLHGYYDADIEALDFNYPSSKEHINAWGKRQTNGMIPNILDKIAPETVACLLNAIYMDAGWQKQFAKEMTRNETFHPGGGKADITLPMMHQTYHFRYVETEDYQALRMNYGTEWDRNATFGMTIVLPKDGRDIADIRSSMTSDELDAVAQTQYLWDVNVALPRFTTDVRTGLTNPLMELGIRQAFDVRNAQFPGIVRQTNLFISDIFQKARIEVAEKGTKAAAITAIHMAASSNGLEPPKPKDFIADRPFLYYITESRTGAIYFMGQFCGE